MLNKTKPPGGLSIGAIERDVGIRSATLRIWERRYGFPSPVRNASGDRIYPEEQLVRLRLIRRLMNQGHRPGKIVPLPLEDLSDLLDESSREAAVEGEIQVLLTAADAQDGAALTRELERLVLRQGLRDFVLKTVAPFLRAIGERWANGDMQIYQEHFVTRQLSRFLDATMNQLGRDDAPPRILLATLPGEQHALGNLMLEVLLTHQGTAVHNLGTEVPIDQLVRAAKDLAVPVLGLSFSGAYPYRSMRNALKELLAQLPDEVTIWVGGSGSAQMRRMPDRRVRHKTLQQIDTATIPATPDSH